jgi:hypothetical protein
MLRNVATMSTSFMGRRMNGRDNVGVCVRACVHVRTRASMCVCVCAFLLKSLKIPKGKSESVYRRSTYNTVSNSRLQQLNDRLLTVFEYTEA